MDNHSHPTGAWSRLLCASGLLLGLTGCANWNSVYRPIYAADGQGALIDVKQRAILVGKRPVENNAAHQHFVICAEPSPDAMSAYAGEFAGKLALSPVGAATGKDESLAIQSAMRETASYIGMRTPSVQLLRDAMYRACEAYANNAINNSQYELLMRRYQRHIVALAAIDQLTQASRVPPMTLTTAGGVGGGRPLDEWMDEITRQQGVQAQKQAAADTAKAKDAVAAIAEAQEVLKKDPNDAAAKKKLKDSDDAQAKAAAAKKAADEEVKRAKDRIASLQAGMTAGPSLGGSTAADVAQAAGGALSEHLQAVAVVVEHIALEVLQTDDTPAMCFGHLAKEPKPDHPLTGVCTAVVKEIKAQAELDAQAAVKAAEDCKADSKKCKPQEPAIRMRSIQRRQNLMLPG